MTVRAWMIYDTHQVELPNHETALANLDYANPRLLIRREKQRTTPER